MPITNQPLPPSSPIFTTYPEARSLQMSQNGAQCPTSQIAPDPNPNTNTNPHHDDPNTYPDLDLTPNLIHRQLSHTQARAISLLAEGHNDSEVARRLFVSRKTINRWRLYDPVFISRLNRARHALWANTLDQLRSLLPTAVATLAQTLSTGSPAERQRAAIQLLKIAGTSRLAPRVGPDNTIDVLTQRHAEHEAALTSYKPLIEEPPTPDELNTLHGNLLQHIRHEEALEHHPLPEPEPPTPPTHTPPATPHTPTHSPIPPQHP